MAQLVKTVNGLAIASVKTWDALAIASVKTILGVDNTAGSFTWNATRFNSGGSSYAQHNGPLTGAADGTAFTIGFWLKVFGADGTIQFILEFGDQAIANPIQLYRKADNTIQLDFRNAVNGSIGGITSTSTIVQASGWVWIGISADLSGGTPVYKLYFDDSDAGSGNWYGGSGTIPYTFASGKWTVGATADGSTGTGDVGISELFCAPTVTDFSDTPTRRNFITAGGDPADLTAYDSPTTYLHNAAASIGTNSGSGGNYGTIVGTPVDLGADKPP